MIYKIKIYLVFVISVYSIIFFSSCKDDIVNVILPEQNHTPIWPQAGYNAQNTGNPYSPKVKCNPVELGQVDWMYEFPNVSYSDGAEFCVDSKNNIYYYSQAESQMKIYKFRPDGSVIWTFETNGQYNFASISLSSDETKIYFNDYGKFCCCDSSGKILWKVSGTTGYNKPIIGKDGTIYTLIEDKVSAVNPDGTIKWKSAAVISFTKSYFALDREDNIYTVGESIKKMDKNGQIMWEYVPKVSDFLCNGVVIDGFGNVYFINYFYNNKNDFYSLTKDGSFRWSAITYGQFCVPVISSNNIIYTVNGNITNAFDVSGKVQWTYNDSNTLDYQGTVLDDDNNIYYIIDDFQSGQVAVSLNSSGVLRWKCNIMNASILPNPALMPMGRMLVAPKRAYKIACVK